LRKNPDSLYNNKPVAIYTVQYILTTFNIHLFCFFTQCFKIITCNQSIITEAICPHYAVLNLHPAVRSGGLDAHRVLSLSMFLMQPSLLKTLFTKNREQRSDQTFIISAGGGQTFDHNSHTAL